MVGLDACHGLYAAVWFMAAAARIIADVTAPTAMSMSPTVTVIVIRPIFAQTGPIGMLNMGWLRRSIPSLLFFTGSR